MSTSVPPAGDPSAATTAPSIAETRSIIRSKLLLAADALERARDSVGPFDGVTHALCYSHDQIFKAETWLAQARYLLAQMIEADNDGDQPDPTAREARPSISQILIDSHPLMKGGA